MTTAKQKKISQAWRDVWESPQGRLAISELLISLNLYSPIDVDTEFAAGVAIGERNVGARIARMLDLKPAEYVQHAQEAVQELDALEQLLKMKPGD